MWLETTIKGQIIKELRNAAILENLYFQQSILRCTIYQDTRIFWNLIILGQRKNYWKIHMFCILCEGLSC